MSSGIDAISYYIPKLYVDLKGEWASIKAQSFSDGNSSELISKIEKGIGITQMSIPDAHEDAVTMAAMAAKRLIEENKIPLKEIGHLLLATESAVDHAKPVGSYVLGLLQSYFKEDCTHIATSEIKFACVSSTYALEYGLALLDSNRQKQPYVLVISTDIAKYDLDTTAEYTQGAGAVSILLSRTPRLLQITSDYMGSYTKDERDFFRPLWRTTPLVDGKYSIDVYSDCITGAFQSFVNLNDKGSPAALLDSTDYFLFHLPFPKMATYAASRLLMPYYLSELSDKKLTEEKKKALQKQFSTSEKFKLFFDQKIKSSLTLSMGIGNLYTSSLYVGLISLIETSLEKQEELTEKRLLAFSYGSGASSKVFAATFSPTWKEASKNLKLRKELKAIFDGGGRLPIRYKDYLRIHPGNTTLVMNDLPEASVIAPSDEFVFIGLGTSQIPGEQNFGMRQYRYTTSREMTGKV